MKAVILAGGRGTRLSEETQVKPKPLVEAAGQPLIWHIMQNFARYEISAGVQLYSHDTVSWAISGGKEDYEYAQTEIGDNCYIGPNTVVAKGVHIGKGSVIGAMSLVLEDVPENAVAFGVPSKVIRKSERKP